jgi:ribokinase
MQRKYETTPYQPKICVVGASNTDLLAKVPRLPKLGETLIGNHFHIGFGGKGANQAVMAAKLGAKVTMVTKLGKDMFGENTFKNYQENGVDTSYIFWDEKEFSGVAPLFVDDQGRNFIVIVPGANFALSPEDVRKASKVIKGADAVICQLEVPPETTREALRLAKVNKIPTLFNPAPGFHLSDEFFKFSDIIAPNEVETEAILGKKIKTVDDAKDAIKEFLKRGSRNGIITLGEKGAIVGNKKGINHIPSIQVKAIDSTGAGDAFIGTLAYFFSIGTSLHKAVRIANVAAALSVTRLGTQLSFPSREEIKKTYNHLFNESLEGG